jgi:bifunctional N-acetylglucosamine-1-phosphate-uridyltransferase/glucosamine-1-phosphate-acetyltransferase GlmU-like protein
MEQEIRTGRRDLIGRVATLELLVSDLIGILHKVDPTAMQQLALDAARDQEIQNTRTLAVAEHQRDRLRTVLSDRQRKLQPKRAGGRATQMISG